MNGKTFVFVDTETSGLSPVADRVIEVGVIRVEDGVVVERFESLVNPEIEISDIITEITGIDNTLLARAPTFSEIGDTVDRLCREAIFVAHNVGFDHNFLKEEFRRIGKEFDADRLCTVELSRRLYPQERSHKLASLIERFGFPYNKRHRAFDDAHVVWDFFQHVHQAHAKPVVDDALEKLLIRAQVR